MDSETQIQHRDEKRKYKKRKIRKKFKQAYGLELGSPENILPLEITFDIFSRLPIESVLQCKQVCKTWKTLLSGAYFADMHLRRSRQLLQLDSNINGGGGGAEVGLGLLFSIQFKNKQTGKVRLYYGGDYVDIKKVKLINHPHINKQKKYALISSCNGLICMAVTQKLHYIFPFYQSLDYDPVYIFNPITREHVSLPRIKKQDSTVACGFGYHPFSNKYKVVRIYYSHNQHSLGQVQVYTLGDGSGWRNKGEIKYNFLFSSLSVGGVLSTGSLHWLDHKDMKIVAFDLADEEFRVLTPPPPCFLPAGYDKFKHCFHLRELGGCLCVVHQVKGERVDIWSLKKKNKNSTAYNMKEQVCHSWTWSRDFSMAWFGDVMDNYDTFALTKSGEVLCLYNRNILYRYDPKTATTKVVVEQNDDLLKFVNIIPHMNSFVSLKALGERCRRRINKIYE
ncbi:F-box domain [Macleaya cordata]|uniref:F-box domain n=1 Tax=Macleaya cordata TaxID=56857 RepID=A0A200QBU6_MACCD|nr:F-box domain [Macleaya cordata]